MFHILRTAHLSSSAAGCGSAILLVLPPSFSGCLGGIRSLQVEGGTFYCWFPRTPHLVFIPQVCGQLAGSALVLGAAGTIHTLNRLVGLTHANFMLVNHEHSLAANLRGFFLITNALLNPNTLTGSLTFRLLATVSLGTHA